VRATRFNHVSVYAADLDESARFYQELFGMQRLPSPLFDVPVVWLRVGDQQLHLFQRGAGAAPYYHFGLDVDDFEAVYLKARELGLLDPDSWGSQIRELPDGSVQMYIRDPAGNLVEVDCPDVSALDRSVVTDIARLADERPQTGEAVRATLYHRPAP
jgi:lactoylglutathione lyase